jgi:lipopolysaccharide transport system ATP-binding protein
MTESVIQVHDLGKRYRIGTLRRHSTLGEAIAAAVQAPFRRARNGASNGSAPALMRGEGHLSVPESANSHAAQNGDASDILWALRHVSFDVRQGEVVGLIGRNGAGKSTLLKILARITRPTEGWAEVRGRVGSLLEVGTGFHPQLTGRENVYLSGAILGMRKAEIARKFDEIVAFAEVDRFLDTQLKHYSSGMQMRLAFAVAAHLEPEILFVDEVLAVGDAAFQKKCLGKMSDVARHGRTILFVSHNMAAMRRLCSRALWIEGGQIRMDRTCQEVASAYEGAMARGSRANKSEFTPRSLRTRFAGWGIANSSGENPHTLNNLDPVTIRVALEVDQPIAKAMHGIALYNHEHTLIWAAWAPQKLQLEVGEYALCHTFPMLPLRPGSYTWLATLYEDGRLIDSWECEPSMVVTTESYQPLMDEWTGPLNLPSRFEARNEAKTAAHAEGEEAYTENTERRRA